MKSNVLKFGNVQALTGPISRGDADLIATQLEAISTKDSTLGSIYSLLGEVALDLAKGQGLSEERGEEVKVALSFANLPRKVSP